jgi:hypothetical protein
LIGRVMSFAMFSAVALDPISFALAGVLVELDLTAMFLAAGALLLLTAVLGALSRTMREADESTLQRGSNLFASISALQHFSTLRLRLRLSALQLVSSLERFS